MNEARKRPNCPRNLCSSTDGETSFRSSRIPQGFVLTDEANKKQNRGQRKPPTLVVGNVLFVVATPIGNLKDITLRALEVLSKADVILTEETRKTGWLIKALGIKTKAKFILFNQNNELKIIQKVVKFLKRGLTVCLVSSAGTPLISDPGASLVSYCFKKNIPVVPIPGPSALTTALSVAGVDIGIFIFLGFLPKKKMMLKKLFTSCLKLNSVDNRFRFFVGYLSPHRFSRTLMIFKEVFGGKKKVFLARELTKINETIGWQTVNDLIAKKSPPKGEMVFGWLIKD